MNDLIRGSSSRPPRLLMTSQRVPPEIYSTKRLYRGVLFSRVMLKPMYLTIRGKFSLDKKNCSFCKDREEESSADLTAIRSPEKLSTARETVAVEPWPMVGPRVQFSIEGNTRKKKVEG